MRNVFVFLLLCIHCSALPITHQDLTEDPYVDYLKTYGWFGEGGDGFDDGVDLGLKIQEFQEFAGLELTGEFDEPTIAKMREPRCGVPDGHAWNQVGSTRRRRRDAFQGSKWDKTNLTYYIGKLTSDIELSEIKLGVEEAVKLWSDNSALSFTEVYRASDADIRLDFVEKEHGDGKDFDGPGQSLGHAFFPNEARRGQAHLDDAETWLGATEQNDPDRHKYNIMVLAAHEIGHVLGLSHTPAKSASLMKPSPVAYERNLQLPSDDVTAIQTLYGKSDNELILDLCNTDTKIRFDAALQGPEGRTLFFSGIHYWEIVRSGIKQGYPKLLFELFPQSERTEKMTYIDAIVMSSTTNKIYVFKDDIFWRFDSNFALDGDFPKLLIETGLPDNIDTAFEHNGRIYIVKKKRVYLFDEETQKTYKNKKLRKAFPGVPKGISAALTWLNGDTYFFRNSKYYKYDEDLGEVAVGYPKSIKGHWLCLGM